MIYGFDPGFASFGFVTAVPDGEGFTFTDARCIVTRPNSAYPKATDLLVRSQLIAEALKFWITAPYAFCIEAMSYPRNASSAVKLGASHGILAALLAEHYPDVIYVESPQHIRKTVTGLAKPTEEETHDWLLVHTNIADLIKDMRKGERPHVLDAAATVAAAFKEGRMV